MDTLPAKLALSRAVGLAARASGRGGGTSLPGRLLLRLDSQALRRLAAQLPRGRYVISATNGKTTTAAISASILERTGRVLVRNTAGANMAGGIASTLLAATRSDGTINGDTGLFEVDEFWLDSVTEQVEVSALVLGNLFRDQLDRYGELESIASRWAQVVAGLDAGSALILNADDPLIADLGREHDAAIYFGVEDDRLALATRQHASDATHCRRCGATYLYESVYLGHLGHYRCPGCGWQRPAPVVQARDVNLHGTTAASFTLVSGQQERPVSLRLPGLYNVYNALAAAALAIACGIDLDTVTAGLEAATAAFGRAETVELAGLPIQILLIKNPAGANAILQTLVLEPGELDLLAILNDNIADGRDVSWIWDADFEPLVPHVRHVVCAGRRASELALRFKYAGLARERLTVEPELSRALDIAAGKAPGRLFALPTYTALIELRAELGRRGAVSPYWS